MGGKLLDYMEAHELLKRNGINAMRAVYVASADEAVRFAGGKPIVLKVISDKALHKTKSGVIKLGLSNDSEIRAAYSELEKKAMSLKPYKILAQDMVRNGLEIIVGGNTDVQFGKMVLIGLGGIYVETFKDFALRVCPITRMDAESMLDQLRSGSVIAPNDKKRRMLVDLLLKVSKMLVKNQEIKELDLNPVILHGESYDAVDLRIIK